MMGIVYGMLYGIGLIPITRMSGYNVGSIEWDNGNIGFV